MSETQDNTTTTPAAVATQELSQEERVYNHEKNAFNAYVSNQGMKIPDNFKDVDSWFAALKNSQSEYTKSRQELSVIKKKYEEAVQQKPSPVPLEASIPKDIFNLPELKIPTVVQDPEVANEDDWKTWTMEYASNQGLAPVTVENIKRKTKLPEFVINEYMSGQKAKLDIAYAKAAELIGGKDKLSNMFNWAAKSLPSTEQQSINQSLASSNWEVTLLGLASKYDRFHTKINPNEPTTGNIKVPVNSVDTSEAVEPYTSKREFSSERNNPKFLSDPRFRKAVEKRMLVTNFNNLGL